MKRGYYIRKKCTVKTCNEVRISTYSTKKEYLGGIKKNKPFTCSRHINFACVLSVDNLKTEVELKCINKIYDGGSAKFWQSGNSLNSGFVFGNGYKAFAEDFTEGTILRVRAEIILPSGTADTKV